MKFKAGDILEVIVDRSDYGLPIGKKVSLVCYWFRTYVDIGSQYSAVFHESDFKLYIPITNLDFERVYNAN